MNIESQPVVFRNNKLNWIIGARLVIKYCWRLQSAGCWFGEHDINAASISIIGENITLFLVRSAVYHYSYKIKHKTLLKNPSHWKPFMEIWNWANPKGGLNARAPSLTLDPCLKGPSASSIYMDTILLKCESIVSIPIRLVCICCNLIITYVFACNFLLELQLFGLGLLVQK